MNTIQMNLTFLLLIERSQTIPTYSVVPILWISEKETLKDSKASVGAKDSGEEGH